MITKGQERVILPSIVGELMSTERGRAHLPVVLTDGSHWEPTRPWDVPVWTRSEVEEWATDPESEYDLVDWTKVPFVEDEDYLD